MYDDDHEVDIYGGYSGFFHQSTAEDSIRPQHPLPSPPAEEYDSDQGLQAVEPGFYLSEVPGLHHNDTQSHSIEAHHIPGLVPDYRRSQTELTVPAHVPALAPETSVSEYSSVAVRVPTIRSDMYQPALGGLHRVSGVQRKDTRRDRVKRFVAGLNPFHRWREFGRRTE